MHKRIPLQFRHVNFSLLGPGRDAAGSNSLELCDLGSYHFHI